MAGAQVGAGTDACERLELVDEVRLIVVATLQRKARPMDTSLGADGADAPHSPQEAADTGVVLGAESHFLLEEAGEVSSTEPSFLRDPRDARHVRHGRMLGVCVPAARRAGHGKGAQGSGHGGMVGQGADQLPHQQLLEDPGACLQRVGLGYPFAQFPDHLTAPQRIQRHLQIVKLAGGWRKEGIEATGLEVHAELVDRKVVLEGKRGGVHTIQQRRVGVARAGPRKWTRTKTKTKTKTKTRTRKSGATQINDELCRAAGKET